MVNYISENLEYLVRLEGSTLDEFGQKFDLKRGIVGQYVRKVSVPKLETIQKICNYFEISIDNFVNEKLSELKTKNYISDKEFLNVVNDPPEGYGFVSLKYVELLENAIRDKDKIIKDLEEKINPDKRKQA